MTKMLWIARIRQRPLAIKLSKYTAGSLVAAATSEVVLVVCYGTGLLGTTAASVVAFFAGAVPNYVLNRRWVWQRRGPVRWRRELLPYAAVSLLTLAAAAAATGWAASLAPQEHSVKVVFVAVAYFVVYGALFVLKFVAYHTFIFAEPRNSQSTT